VHRRSATIAHIFRLIVRGIQLALAVMQGASPMRISILAALIVTLVPAAALADDEQTTTQPKVDDGGYVTPHSVPYEGGAIPKNAFIERRPNLPLIGAGVGIFGASYLGALIYGLSTCSAQEACRQGSGFLYIPVIGPFITMATAPTTGGAALAGFDGGVQVLGAALAITGFLAPKKFVVWQNKSAAVSVMPTNIGAGASAGVAVTVSHF
jgi:hypothetical protein